MLRAFTKGEDIRVAGGEPVIDHNPAIDRKPCFAGEFRIRPYADRADHEIGGKEARAGQFETDSAIFAQNPFCVGAEQHLDALGLDRALEKGGRAIIELALHQAVHQMDKRHFHAGLGKAISRLHAEQAAADHRRAGARPHQGAHRADIG
jgi:hypothetical protein